MPALLDDAELLRRLVAFDSVSRNSNLPIAEFICDYLDRPGIRIARNPTEDDTKTNLIITAGPATGPDRRGLVLSGHMDVVPADEPDWESDPFTLEQRSEVYVGRGTADMKGFLALAMNRMALHDPERLTHPLALLFTFDEELGTLGARHFAETWKRTDALPRSVVIGEPTSLRAVRMHKGHLKLGLTLRGIPAHSGYPHLGHNAIEPAARAVAALSGLRAELEAERPQHADVFAEVPFVAVNIAQIRGGTALNVVPDFCEVLIGARILPGMESDTFVARVRRTLDRALGDQPYTLDVLGDSPPFLLEEEHPLHRLALDVAHQHRSRSVSFATDAGWFQTIGFDCVILGPGSIEVAHKPNESIPIAEFERGARLLDELVDRCCAGQGG